MNRVDPPTPPPPLLGLHGLDRLRRLIDEPELPERYELLARLGRGGMGSVFLVHDRDLDRDVALKVLSLPETEGELDARLAREARVLASLEHPGIVPIHDLGRLPDGRLFYTMKRVEGRTLGEHCRSERLSLRARLELIRKLCDALSFAHARGIIHRDLKPENVMVGSFGELLLMDWGLATHPGAEDGSRAAGTPGYMAPEQVRGEPADARTDVWAVGAILADLLGDRPPRPLAAIRDRARTDDPAARYADAGALAADLVAWAEDSPVSAHRETPSDRIGRAVRRHRFVILLVVAFIVVRLVMLLGLRH